MAELLPGPLTDTTVWMPLVWAAILAVAVMLYVVLDGFDLGIGILFPLHPAEEDRDVMMNSVAPFWDGNETWLILGGGGLLVAFPAAYAIIMPALYLPIIIMVLALVFRGVAFEFRWVAKPNHALWDLAFSGGSIVATFMQGVILGGLLQGITTANKVFTGGMWDWLTPFSVFIGLAMLAGYALLGSTWLVMKTEGEVALEARRRAVTLLVIVVLAMAIVSLVTPLLFERIADRWFSLPNFFFLAPIPILTLAAAFVCWLGLNSGAETQPFIAAIFLFVFGFFGLVASNAPLLVPHNLTVWDLAGHVSAQTFSLIGVAIMLPIILGYTVFVYYTFRGKIRPGEGYH